MRADRTLSEVSRIFLNELTVTDRLRPVRFAPLATESLQDSRIESFCAYGAIPYMYMYVLPYCVVIVCGDLNVTD